MISVRNHIDRKDALLGLVRAEGLQVDGEPAGFGEALQALLDARRSDLDDRAEAVRRSARDLLRNGRYRPTGRGKPASEYLIRAAQQEAAFPRINGPVDVNNYISLKYVLPASLWDLDRAATDRFVFRLGRTGEAYVFNAGGQEIEVEDLIVGCRVLGEAEEPIVNPVKDSLLTKTTEATTRVGACIYAPADAVSREELRAVCAEFAQWLAACGTSVEATYDVVAPGDACTV